MDKAFRFIDVLNAMRIFAALAVADLVAAGVYKIKEVWSAKGHNSNVLDADTDTRIYIPSRDRDRSGDNKPDRDNTHTLEEKVMVLNTFRMGATWFEKCVLDEISDDLIELDAIKFLQSKTKQKTDMSEEAKREQG